MTALKIAYLAAAVVFALAAGPANAKSLWTQINETSPRAGEPVEFVERDMSKVFTDLADIAPHSDSYFGTLNDSAP